MIIKEQRVSREKADIRDRLIKAVFEPLAHTHEDAMEAHLSEVSTHLGHRWTIERTQSIWTIACTGPDADWGVRFDIGWRIDSCDLPYKAIDTFTVDYDIMADTALQLKLAIQFVADFLATYKPDGSIIED